MSKPFPSRFEPHYESEAPCIVFLMKTCFHLRANKTNFHMKILALSLAFEMRLTEQIGDGIFIVEEFLTRMC